VGDTIGRVLGGSQSGLSQNEIARGLREALEVGTTRAVDDLATTDAFYANPSIHIPLPSVLADAQDTLRPFGLAGLLDDLELRLNRGAEQAMPEARRIFTNAIASLTFDDVIDIWRGPDDAATRYFQRTTTTPLAAAMRDPVEDALNQAGAVRLYDQLISQARAVPGLPDLRTDLTDHVLDLALDALFGQLAVEEARIREDPLARSTELLRRVFGTLDA
ncbi:MAG: DUF4197 domain-containing protein, partial [Geminicoccaceae bacterium]|nr:DUF4197 domain-containing protein [Geminicoccaceae bacterium]